MGCWSESVRMCWANFFLAFAQDAGHEAGKAADNVKQGASDAASSAQVRR